jgi:hypothetical protein
MSLGSLQTKILVGAGITAFLLTTIIVWFVRHDARVIADHDAKRASEQATKALQAERQANTNSAARQEDARRDQKELQNVQQEAEKRDPVGSAGTVGPATDAVIDGLRRQRAAHSAAR